MAEAELTTIARPYARAVFSAAVEQNRLREWSATLGLLSNLSVDGKVRQLLDSPALTHAQRADVLLELCGSSVDEGARNLVHILAEYQRIPLLPEIARLYETLKANHEKTVEVEIISAFSVSDEDNQRLTAILKEKLKRDVHIQSRVDASLLGGLIVKTEDSVIDGSVRGKLARLTQVLNT